MPHFRSGDAQIYYELDGPVDAPVLLLSNSLGTTLDMWAPQIAQTFRVLRYDTRGHGRSSVPPGPYSIAQLGGDLVNLLEHLGLDRVNLCGLSMGGITAMWLAVHHPERIERLVLSNTAAYIGPASNWSDRASAVIEKGMEPIVAAVVARWLTPDFARSHPSQVAILQAMLRATDPAGYAANCLAVRDSDLRRDIARISAPTLIISGTGDLPTPPSDGLALAEAIAQSQYLELPAAHLSNQEQPEQFNAAVVAFFLAH